MRTVTAPTWGMGENMFYAVCHISSHFDFGKKHFSPICHTFFRKHENNFRKNYVNKDFRPITLFSSLFSKRAANMQKGRVKRARASQITEKKVRVEGGRERRERGVEGGRRG